MAFVKVGNIDIAYEQFGDDKAPAMLLIMGLGAQLIHWPDAFCRQLADGGFRVIRFDNRDAGLSSKLDDLPAPSLLWLQATLMTGLPINAPYTLKEMAGDAAGLLERLGIRSAHVVGASMGGMIAQEMAIHHTLHVRSLICIMSSSGDPALPGARMGVLSRAMFGPLSNDREALIAHRVRMWQTIGSPEYPTPVEDLRRLVISEIDRGYYPEGFKRQLAAIVASDSRLQGLAGLGVPALVIHGDADPLIPLPCGADIARRIPGARMEVIAGMGHDLPDSLTGRMAGLIVDHTKAA